MFFFLFEIDFQWTKSIPFLTYPQCSVKNSISWRKDKTKLSATVRYWRKIVFVTRLSFLQYRQPYKADLLSIWKHGNAEGVKVIIITQWEQQVDGYGGRLDWGGTVGNMVGIALIRKGTYIIHTPCNVCLKPTNSYAAWKTVATMLVLKIGVRCTDMNKKGMHQIWVGLVGWLRTGGDHILTLRYSNCSCYNIIYILLHISMSQIGEGPGYTQDASLGGCDGGRD